MNHTPALSVQVGGTHYKDCAIQPIQYIEANRLDFLEGCVVKRLTRHDKPTGKGRQDIEKAIHELQLLLEMRYSLPKQPLQYCDCTARTGCQRQDGRDCRSVPKAATMEHAGEMHRG
ncbi:hypothetical protein [Bradyrhizobium sp. BWC-3-1]|uniref:hypothetical protein n=1 Tax=Bradyrhizobium sp. BWC-3-1 TaxID=3080012 RepID=UPI00293E6507|nr:hypothetical protein [Bradyrhizobium sp. BWC-3-1]WOH61954.1 hypothetical protein RX329_18405 [Bradyrhizobium sp. BWC-3-1]